MATPEQSELVTYVSQLIEATRKGEMEWARANPTTYLWETKIPQPARLTLQQVEKREINRGPLRAGVNQNRIATTKTYLLQVHDLVTSGQPRLTASGSDDPSTNESLKTLFEVISSGVTRKGLDFLKAIIPKGSGDSE